MKWPGCHADHSCLNRALTAAFTVAWNAVFAARSTGTSITCLPPASACVSSWENAAAESDANRLPAEAARETAEIEAMRNREHLLEHRPRQRAGGGQVLEYAAAVVVAHDDREVGILHRAGEQSRHVVQQREVAAPEHRRPAERRGRAERRGHHAVDPVHAAVRQQPQARNAVFGERVDVTDDHAVRGIERGAIRQPGPDRARKVWRQESLLRIAGRGGACPGGAVGLSATWTRHSVSRTADPAVSFESCRQN